MSGLKAWETSCYSDDTCLIVYAESRGKARSTAMLEIDCEFIEVYVRRLKSADEFAKLRDEPELEEDPSVYLALGFWVECAKCSSSIFPGDRFTSDGLFAYCEECRPGEAAAVSS